MKRKYKYFIVGAVFAVWIIFFDQSNLMDWGTALADLSKQRAEKQFYEREISRIRQQLRELQSNRDSLEKFAREQYYYLEDGEVIFIVEENKR
ncbi:MAG: septum formation initiator family protein [Bacteroidales bacterium]|nr:septum formation initiator family protein [Bacteroidales bacterium]